MKCENKIILITGASSGIGAATALKLASRKNHIVITARREELLKNLSEKIEKLGSTCSYYCGDATNEKHAEDVVARIVKEQGRIDIALLNVGIGPPSNTLTASASKIKFCMETNYNSFINFYVPLIKQMQQQSTKCVISHMNSQASWFGVPMQGDYTAAKSAARIFMETARMELKHFGYKHIILQTIHPGFVNTLAVKNDGIPAPNEISEEKAAELVIKGFEKEKKVNTFPAIMRWQTYLARILPPGLIARILLSQTPKNY